MSPALPDAVLVAELRAKLALADDTPAIEVLGEVPRAYERFLIAHSLNVEKAADAMRDTLNFRQEHFLDANRPPPPAIAKVAPHWPGGFIMTSADGHGVFFFGYRHLIPRDLMRAVTEAEFQTFYLDFMDRMSQHTTSCNPPNTGSAGWKRPIEVHDLRGLAFSTHVHPPSLLILARTIALGQLHYPDHLHQAVFIHAPRWFSTLWSFLRLAQLATH